LLKITIVETPTQRRWVVQGCLAGPWVGELRATWERVKGSQDDRACIIDLNDVTFIDKDGERLLRAMSKKGAHLTASGIYTKHVLEKLKTTGKRVLVTLILCLFTVPRMNVIVTSPRTEMNATEDCGLRFHLANPLSRLTETSLSTNREEQHYAS
jgi:hypothetical protein